MKKIIVLLMLLGIMFGAVIAPEFRGNKMGISSDKIVEENEPTIINEEYEYMIFPVDWNGYSGYATYIFDKDKLYFGSYYFVGSEVIDEWTEVLVATYGYGKSAGEGIIVWTNPSNNMVIRTELSKTDDYDIAISIQIYDKKVNERIIAEEKKRKAKKL